MKNCTNKNKRCELHGNSFLINLLAISITQLQLVATFDFSSTKSILSKLLAAIVLVCERARHIAFADSSLFQFAS